MKFISAIQIVFITVLISISLGCVKKRPDQWTQGQGRDLEAISLLDGKTFSVSTGKSINKTNSASTVKPIVESSVTEFNFFDLVEYNAPQATLLPENVEFRGRENTTSTYKIKYWIDDSYLKVLKVGKKEDIPIQEMDYAIKLDNDEFGVPLVGYKVEHIQRVASLNGDNEKTHQFIEMKLQGKDGSEFIRINRNSAIRFEALSKNEVYPVDFFGIDDPNSKWYFMQTIVDGSFDNEAAQGIFINQDSDNLTASKVKFIRKSEKQIEVINAVSPLGYNTANKIHAGSVMTINGEFLDFRAVLEGATTALKEEKYSKRHYADREYFKWDFSSIKTSSELSNGHLQEVQFGNYNGRKYFAFVLLVGNDEKGNASSSRAKIRFSFLEAPKQSTYKPKIAHKDDLRSFGPITRQIPFVNNFRVSSKKDFEEKTLMARHNSKKKIIFNLGDTTPIKFTNAAENMVLTWKEYLNKNGVPLDIEFDPTPQKVGDIRYNTINFVESNIQARWLGVNISLTDEETGEVISTMVQINISTTKNAMIGYLKQWLRYKLGVTSTLNFTAIESSQPSTRSDGVQALSNNPLLKNLGGLYTLSNGQGIEFKKFEQNENQSRPSFIPKSISNEIKCYSGLSAAHLFEKAEKLCQNDLIPYLNSLHGQKIPESFGFDLATLEKCSESISENGDIYQLIGVHEVGHALGLAHNFKGSADKNNFYQKGETNTENDDVLNASIMDYFPIHEKDLTIPGKYDIAAMRFIYFDEVEVENATCNGSKFCKVDTSRSLKDQGMLSHIKPYMYCDNPDSENNFDPFCNMHDIGTTPLELATYYINSNKDTLQSILKRYDRSRYGNFNYVSQDVHLKLKRIYDEYRYYLAQIMGFKDNYLSQFDQNNWSQYLDDLERANANTKRGNLFSEYRKAAEIIQDYFLNDVAFMSNQYCKVYDNNKKVNLLVEVSKIRESFNTSYDDEISNCESPGAIAYFKHYNLTLEKEVGTPLLPSWYNTDLLNPGRESYDVLGSIGEKLNGFNLVNSRMTQSPLLLNKNIFPNLMDDPVYRKRVETRILNRVLKGVSLDKDGQGRYYPNFSAEGIVIPIIVDLFKKGLAVPNDVETTLNRLTPFQVTPTPYASMAKGSVASAKFGSLTFMTQSLDNYFANSLLNMHKMISDSDKISPVSSQWISLTKEILRPFLLNSIEEQERYTFGSFAKTMTILESLSFINPNLQYWIDSNFSLGLEILKSIITSATNEMAKDESQKAEFEKFVNFQKSFFESINSKKQLTGADILARANSVAKILPPQLSDRPLKQSLNNPEATNVILGQLSASNFEQSLDKFNENAMFVSAYKRLSPEELEAQKKLIMNLFLNSSGSSRF